MVVKPYLLADIGEGITECQVIQWFVKPGARVEQFDPICEVQSDKASVEITSRFDGVIKRLYYEPDDMAKVGKPLVDIDIQSDISAADEALLNEGLSDESPEPPTSKASDISDDATPKDAGLDVERHDTKVVGEETQPTSEAPIISRLPKEKEAGKYTTLATPAVRHMVKTFNLRIEDIEGTGKEGRVTKDDVQKFNEALNDNEKKPRSMENGSMHVPPAPTQDPAKATRGVDDHVRPLTPVQTGMFKQMTKSLSIPHLLYTDGVDFSTLNAFRAKYNRGKDKVQRVSPLAFILKAVSLSLQQFPLLNAHLDTWTNPHKPQMLIKGQHNIGIAIDSPSGLLVPVIKNVQAHSIESIATEIIRLSTLARDGKITNADLMGATFTLSNIGSIGGGVVAPVIVTPQVAILGVGKTKIVPAFGENGEIIRKEECTFSWSADHRVIDGALAARCAETVRGYLENIESMLIRLR